MHDHDGVQRVLKNWGVTVLDGEGKDAEESPVKFLSSLREVVQVVVDQ
ncbi:hypothetical protein ABVB72_23320 [Rhizobium nepotum]